MASIDAPLEDDYASCGRPNSPNAFTELMTGGGTYAISIL